MCRSPCYRVRFCFCIKNMLGSFLPQLFIGGFVSCCVDYVCLRRLVPIILPYYISMSVYFRVVMSAMFSP